MGACVLGTAPPKNGTPFAVIDIPPGSQPHMHRTDTIDYVMVIEGENRHGHGRLDRQIESR
jgi:hypothetical protein